MVCVLDTVDDVNGADAIARDDHTPTASSVPFTSALARKASPI